MRIKRHCQDARWKRNTIYIFSIPVNMLKTLQFIFKMYTDHGHLDISIEAFYSNYHWYVYGSLSGYRNRLSQSSLNQTLICTDVSEFMCIIVLKTKNILNQWNPFLIIIRWLFFNAIFSWTGEHIPVCNEWIDRLYISINRGWNYLWLMIQHWGSCNIRVIKLRSKFKIFQATDNAIFKRKKKKEKKVMVIYYTDNSFKNFVSIPFGGS